MKTLTSSFLLAGSLVLAQMVPAVAVAAMQDNGPGIDAAMTDDRPQSDAEYYAKEFGVSIAEAERRNAIVEASTGIAAALRNEFAPRMAGMYLEHQPELRIVIRLTGDTAVPARQLATAAGSLPIVFVTGARATLAELQAALDAHASELTAIPSKECTPTSARERSR